MSLGDAGRTEVGGNSAQTGLCQTTQLLRSVLATVVVCQTMRLIKGIATHAEKAESF